MTRITLMISAVDIFSKNVSCKNIKNSELDNFRNNYYSLQKMKKNSKIRYLTLSKCRKKIKIKIFE